MKNKIKYMDIMSLVWLDLVILWYQVSEALSSSQNTSWPTKMAAMDYTACLAHSLADGKVVSNMQYATVSWMVHYFGENHQ